MFSKSKSLISIAALVVSGFVVGPVPAHAAASCVVDTFDGVSGTTTITDCLGSISADGEITFGTTTAQTITVTTGLTLSADNVTINGAGLITLEKDSGLTDDSMLSISAATKATIKGLIFDGAEVDRDSFVQGGAIKTASTDLTIEDSRFVDNRASQGGAVYGVNVTVTRSTFLENQSDEGEGGALVASGDSEIFESTFKDNKSLEDHGGAISTEKISITDSDFIDNVANFDKDDEEGEKYKGGAIKADEVESISGSTFDGNKVEAHGDGDEDALGGAIYVGEMSSDADYELEITNSIFVRNEAGSAARDGKGGAIFFDTDFEGEIVISNSRFGDLDDDSPETSGNKAFGEDGGAIIVESESSSASMTVTDSTFAFNEGDKGGAILVRVPLTIERSLFHKNKGSDDGGAIEAESDVTISDSSFVGNTSEEDGGAIVADARLKITKSFFSNNEAGKDGDSNRDGGAIEAESVFIENSTFHSNSAKDGGGALSIKDYDFDSVIALSTFVDNSAAGEAPSIYAKEASGTNPVYLFGNLFLSSSSDSQLTAETNPDVTDLGANVSTSADSFLDAETSEDEVDYASLGVGTPATATLSLRPFVPIDSISTLEVEVTEDLADNYEDVTSETLPTVDQQGTTRTFSFYPGAEFIAFGVSSTPAPYSGPLVTSIDSNSAATNVSASDTVTVSGQRLSTVIKVVVGGLEGEVISTSADSFEMVVPEGLDPGNYDLEIQSSIGNLTYLGAFVVSSSPVSSQAFGEVTAWTTRVSDTQVKVYVKYPTVGEKLRIGHQSGGSGSYESVFVKTTASEDDPSMIVNEHGSYIVRTIELDAINRIRVTVGEETMVQVRYNN